MYKYTEQQQMILPHEFFLPFGGKLNSHNQWCQLAAMIPWSEIEEKYAKNFKNLKSGQEALSVRIALGALIIQNRKGLSDRQTVDEIVENPYMQYFIGLKSFLEKPPFDASLMVHFRKRFGKDIINEINEMIVKDAAKPEADDDDKSNPSKPDDPDALPAGNEAEKPKNAGKLILDATCTSADIHYPTNIWLVNETREALEEIIDVLYEPHIGQSVKPRTYRESARKKYLNIEKKKKLTAKKIRKAIGQQLRYIRCDLQIIRKLVKKSPLTLLNKRQYRNLVVCHEILPATATDVSNQKTSSG
jgi:IS5 family transposase